MRRSTTVGLAAAAALVLSASSASARGGLRDDGGNTSNPRWSILSDGPAPDCTRGVARVVNKSGINQAFAASKRTPGCDKIDFAVQPGEGKSRVGAFYIGEDFGAYVVRSDGTPFQFDGPVIFVPTQAMKYTVQVYALP